MHHVIVKLARAKKKDGVYPHDDLILLVCRKSPMPTHCITKWDEGGGAGL